ncbi:uncharacterized protein LOC144165708 [Haemaphysalis longicornis]
MPDKDGAGGSVYQRPICRIQAVVVRFRECSPVDRSSNRIARRPGQMFSIMTNEGCNSTGKAWCRRPASKRTKQHSAHWLGRCLGTFGRSAEATMAVIMDDCTVRRPDRTL